MASRRSRWPAAALLVLLLLGGGCSQAAPPGLPPVPASAPAPRATETATAPDLARRTAGHPLPDVVGDGLARARRRLQASGARTQVVAFDADAAVTSQHPRGGESPPADGVVTVWIGEPPALPPSAPPAPAASRPVVPDGDEAPVVTEPSRSSGGSASGLAAGEDEAGTDPGDGPEIPEPAPRTPGSAPAGPRATGTVLEGPATWYGPGFTGNRTACGGRFDPDELTMASRELACGTRARVTGPSGRSVDVTVTDWGPAEWTGNRFDLSAAAFSEIANPSAGAVPVVVEVLR